LSSEIGKRLWTSRQGVLDPKKGRFRSHAMHDKLCQRSHRHRPAIMAGGGRNLLEHGFADTGANGIGADG
jgi:hypothetical protein